MLITVLHSESTVLRMYQTWTNGLPDIERIYPQWPIKEGLCWSCGNVSVSTRLAKLKPIYFHDDSKNLPLAANRDTLSFSRDALNGFKVKICTILANVYSGEIA
jgi:murein endopeptidase